jgi:hypothetical protein
LSMVFLIRKSEQRTLNIEHRTSNGPASPDSAFDVGCWMFDVFSVAWPCSEMSR